MASITITRNTTLPDSSAKSDFHNLVDTATATISNISGGDISSIATANKVSAISLFNMASLASGAGLMPYFNIVSSLASGSLPIFDGTANFVGAPYSSANQKEGSTTRDMTTASGTQAVTGVGFQPTLVLFFYAVSGNAAWGIGYDSGSSPKTVADAHNSSANTMATSNNSIRAIMGSAGVTEYTGIISSMDADGFTITWTKTGSPTGTLSIFYIAFK